MAGHNSSLRSNQGYLFGGQLYGGGVTVHSSRVPPGWGHTGVVTSTSGVRDNSREPSDETVRVYYRKRHRQ